MGLCTWHGAVAEDVFVAVIMEGQTAMEVKDPNDKFGIWQIK
jgi:hypothetical protein